MESIWSNTFYDTPPALSWTFKANFSQLFPPMPVAVMNNEGAENAIAEHLAKNHPNSIYSNILSNAVVSVSVGKREANATDVYYAGLQFKKITRVNNTGTLSFTFNENENYDVTSVLEYIYDRDAMNQKYTTYDISYRNADQYIPKIIIKTYYSSLISGVTDDEKETEKLEGLEDLDNLNTAKTYTFYGCVLQDIDTFELSYDSKGNITRQAVFMYNYMIVE